MITGDWSARSGYELGHRLSADQRVSAVFVANDQMALGVLRAMHEHGRRIPDEVSVVGFDDIPEAPYFLPPLTTVRQDFDRMGSHGVRLLLQMIEVGEAVEQAPGLRPELWCAPARRPSPWMRRAPWRWGARAAPEKTLNYMDVTVNMLPSSQPGTPLPPAETPLFRIIGRDHRRAPRKS